MEEPRRISDDRVIDDGLPLVAKSSQPAKKRGLTVRRIMVLITGVACAMWIIRPAYIIFDFMIGGPYLTTFTLKYQNIAMDAKLVGRPEKDIVAILGSPAEIKVRNQGSSEKTYVYAPVSYFPLGAVEVQCSQGVVVSIDPWDD